MTAFIVAALLLQMPPVAGGWSDVTRLPKDATIRVRLDAGAVTGRLVSATPDAIVLHAGRRDVTINRARVNAIDRATGRSHRARNIGIGFIAGMGVGAVIYGASCRANCMAEGAPVLTAPLGLVGLIAGAAAPAADWRPVYRR